MFFGVYNCKLLIAVRTKVNRERLKILSATQCQQTMDFQPELTTRAKMEVRDGQKLSAHGCKLVGESMLVRTHGCLSICSYIDSSQKDNMLWQSSGHPCLWLAILYDKKYVLKHLFAFEHTLSTLPATYKADSATDARCIYRGSQ